jgi:hypothetical protein
MTKKNSLIEGEQLRFSSRLEKDGICSLAYMSPDDRAYFPNYDLTRLKPGLNALLEEFSGFRAIGMT